MRPRQQPQSLLSFALQRLITIVESYEHPYDDVFLCSLRNYLTIPPNLFDCWADDLLSSLNRSHSKRSIAQYLVFESALTRLSLDDFPSLQGTVAAYCHLLPRCSGLKHLSSRYAPFFWTCAEVRLLEQSIQHLRNLLTLTLCNLDLNENPTLLQTIGTHCQKIKELDLSHGRIPVSQCKVIVENFPELEVLKMRQKSEKFRTITQKEAVRILTHLLKLRVLDDDTSAWSCLLPALKQLSCENHAGPFACVGYLPVYHCDLMDIETRYVQKIAKIKLDGRAFKRSDGADIAQWLHRTMPGLQSLSLHLDNVWFPTLERFLQCQFISSKVHSIHLSSMLLSYSQLLTIARCASDLRKLVVVNSSPLDIDSETAQLVGMQPRLFSQLEYLSYTGAWDDSVASLLLDHSVRLKELHLKTCSLPLRFLHRNPLAELHLLVLDLSYIPRVYDVELDFLRRVVQTATSLREIRVNSRPTQEWEDLRQQLKTANFDLQILRPI